MNNINFTIPVHMVQFILNMNLSTFISSAKISKITQLVLCSSQYIYI